MYYGNLKKVPFRPDESHLSHEKEREAYIRQLRQSLPAPQEAPPPEGEKEGKGVPAEEKESLTQLLSRVCPEDGALIALILFLLCDNTENDVVLLGILLYVLLAA